MCLKYMLLVEMLKSLEYISLRGGAYIYSFHAGDHVSTEIRILKECLWWVCIM